MVCSLPPSAAFQPALPTALRWETNVVIRVPGRRKCVCMSMMNWPERRAARSSARSGVCASASDTPKSGP